MDVASAGARGGVSLEPRVGERYTLVLPGLPAERQPNAVHTVSEVADGIVRWAEGGETGIRRILDGGFRRVADLTSYKELVCRLFTMRVCGLDCTEDAQAVLAESWRVRDELQGEEVGQAEQWWQGLIEDLLDVVERRAR